MGDLYDVLHHMGSGWQAVMSDASGNNERMVFLYDSTRVIRLDEMGQIGFSRPRWRTGYGSTGCGGTSPGSTGAPTWRAFSSRGSP